MKLIITVALCAILFSCTKEKSEIMEFASNNANTSSRPLIVSVKESTFYPVYSLYNSCTQEYVDFKGSITIKVNIVLDSVRAKYTVHLNYQNMVGVGQKTGNIYKAKETFVWTYSVDKNSEVKYTERSTVKYTCKTSVYTLTYNVKYTLSSEGIKSIILDNILSTCD